LISAKRRALGTAVGVGIEISTDPCHRREWHRVELAGLPQPEVTQAPHHLGQCHSWAYDSPTVQRAYPMFYKPKALLGKG
jgi:hypothetical protein